MYTRLSRRQTKLIGSRKASRGLTLIESMAAMATAVIALGSVVPGLQDLRERKQLEGAAAQIATDLLHARTLSVANGISVRFNTQQAVDGMCYVVHTGAHGDCTCTGAGTAQCSASAQVLRVVGFGTGQPVHFTNNSQAITFDPTRGTVTPTATLTVSTAHGASISKVISLVGRVRTCSPGGSMAGYLSC